MEVSVHLPSIKLDLKFALSLPGVQAHTIEAHTCM